MRLKRVELDLDKFLNGFDAVAAMKEAIRVAVDLATAGTRR